MASERRSSLACGSVHRCMYCLYCILLVASPCMAAVFDGVHGGGQRRLPWAPRRNLFPTGVAIDVRSDLGAAGDGETNDTDVLVLAVANATGRMLFFPSGVYVVSKQLRAQALLLNGSRGAYHSDTFLTGENAGNVTIRLADRAAGYGDANAPQAVIYTATQNPYLAGGGGNQAFHNNLRDLTVHVGANSGATAIDFLANNQGGLVRVALLGDKSGGIGLSMQRGEQGPTFVKHVLIVGFAKGIAVAVTECSIVYEHVFLEQQTTSAIENVDNTVTFRGLHVVTDVRNRPVIINSVSLAKPTGHSAPTVSSAATSLMTILDSTVMLSAPSTSGCCLDNSVSGSMVLRNITIHGCLCSVNNSWRVKYRNGTAPPPQAKPTGTPITTIHEWSSSQPISIGPATTLRQSITVNLTVMETPEDTDGIYSSPQQWAGVFMRESQPYATKAFQKALDNGKPLVYLPHWPVHSYLINSTVFIGVDTTHILGMQSTLESCGDRFEDPLTPVAVLQITDQGQHHQRTAQFSRKIPHDHPLWIEDLNFFQYTDSAAVCGYRAPSGSVAIDHRSTRPLVLRHVSLGGVGYLGIQAASIRATQPGIGPLFIEDCYGGKLLAGGGVRIWARQFNPEPRTTVGDAHIEVSGGSTMWLLGLKIEQPGPVIRSMDSTVELFGGFLYPLLNCSLAFMLQDSKASLSYVVESWHPWDQTQYRVQVNESNGCASPRGALHCEESSALWTYGAHGYPTAIGPTAETRNGYGAVVPLFRTRKTDDEAV